MKPEPRAEAVLCRYHYDALDRLAAATPLAEATVQRVYQKNRLSVEIQGALHRRVMQFDDHVLAEQRAAETVLPATDLQRSVLHSVDAQGQQGIAYSPYGHRPSGSDVFSLLGFAGERPDPVTGHYPLGKGYRSYNPVLMRFNQPDSLSPFGEGGLNAYAYCQGDPVNWRDPTGYMPWPHSSMSPLSRNSLQPSLPLRMLEPRRPSLATLPAVPFQKLQSYLPGKDLISLSRTSKDLAQKVRTEHKAIKKGTFEKYSFERIVRVMQGRERGVLPSQAKFEITLELKSRPQTDIDSFIAGEMRKAVPFDKAEVRLWSADTPSSLTTMDKMHRSIQLTKLVDAAETDARRLSEWMVKIRSGE
jgi:RHS repeat-associated protein